MLPPFPNPVDESVARVTAGEVVVINVVVFPSAACPGHALAVGQLWLLPVVAADYTVRALVGPRYSPLARLAMVMAPRLGLQPRWTAGPPKRFAATIGASMMLAASVLVLTGPVWAAYALTGIMVLFPALESFVGLCIGCKLFALLMRVGMVPQDVCAECADITTRLANRPEGA